MVDGFASDFKRFFLRGLATVLPTLLTLAIIMYVFRLVHVYVGRYINIGVLWLIRQYFERWGDAQGFPSLADKWDTYFWWVGFLLAIAVVYILGRFAASFFGRGIWKVTERFLIRIPIINMIYPHVKQVTDVVFSENQLQFSQVVAVEYPRRGVWSVGLVTSAGMRILQEVADNDLLTVFANALREEAGVSINQVAINQINAQLTGGQ